MERYAKNLCGRIDAHLPTEKKPFLLNKPAVPNKHTIVKSADVSLKESVMLQVTYDSKLKKQEKNIKPLKHGGSSTYTTHWPLQCRKGQPNCIGNDDPRITLSLVQRFEGEKGTTKEQKAEQIK